MTTAEVIAALETLAGELHARSELPKALPSGPALLEAGNILAEVFPACQLQLDLHFRSKLPPRITYAVFSARQAIHDYRISTRDEENRNARLLGTGEHLATMVNEIIAKEAAYRERLREQPPVEEVLAALLPAPDPFGDTITRAKALNH